MERIDITVQAPKGAPNVLKRLHHIEWPVVPSKGQTIITQRGVHLQVVDVTHHLGDQNIDVICVLNQRPKDAHVQLFNNHLPEEHGWRTIKLRL